MQRSVRLFPGPQRSRPVTRLESGVSVNQSQSLLNVTDLSKSFGAVHAVRQCNLSLPAGGVYGLIGPNGSGKSTLVNLLSGVTAPSAGSIEFAGHVVTRWPTDRRARSGLVRTFQTARLWPALSVAENLIAAAPARGRESLVRTFLSSRALRAVEAEDRAKARPIMEEFNLWPLRNSHASELSGGQARLLEFGRILMSGASLALLDEPLAGVNPVMADQVLDGIVRLNTSGVTILIIEHDLGVIRKLCTTVFAMSLGNIFMQGTIDELSATEAFADAYLGSSVRGVLANG